MNMANVLYGLFFMKHMSKAKEYSPAPAPVSVSVFGFVSILVSHSSHTCKKQRW